MMALIVTSMIEQRTQRAAFQATVSIESDVTKDTTYWGLPITALAYHLEKFMLFLGRQDFRTAITRMHVTWTTRGISNSPDAMSITMPVSAGFAHLIGWLPTGMPMATSLVASNVRT